MADPPSISVITPSFNQARFILKNIESVLEQGLEDFEHIVIDGGSTDGTVELLKLYPHLMWVSEPDRGQSDALNKAMAMSRGEVIAWINSDDFYAPGALKAVRDFFVAHPAARLVCGNTVRVDEQGQLTRQAPPKLERWKLLSPWKGQTGIFQQGIFFHREVYDRCGPFDVALNYAMDYDFFLRATQLYPIHYISADLGCFRVYDESKTGRGWEPFQREVDLVLTRYVRRMRGSAAARWCTFRFYLYRARRWVLSALAAYETGAPARARGLLLKAFLRNPFSLLCYPHLCFRLRQLVGRRTYDRLRGKWRRIRRPADRKNEIRR